MSEVKIFIQNVHHFRDYCTVDAGPPVDTQQRLRGQPSTKTSSDAFTALLIHLFLCNLSTRHRSVASLYRVLTHRSEDIGCLTYSPSLIDP